MTIRELKNNRNKLMTDAQQLLLKEKVTVENRTEANKMLADANLLDADITNLEKIEKTTVEERSAGMPNRPNPGEETANDPKEQAKLEKRALARYMQYGIVDYNYLKPSGLPAAELRDITTGGNNSTLSAAYTVPQAFYPVLTEALKSYGEILNVIKNLDVDNGAPTKYATISDVVGTKLTIVGEAQQVDENDPDQMSGAIISSDFASTGIIKISIAELQDSAFDLDAWVKKAFGIRYYRGLSNWVTNGNASNVASLVGSATSGATSTYTNQIVYADLAAMYAALDPAYRPNAVWSFNTNTQGLLLGQCDNIGRPLFIPAATAESFDTLLGKKVVLSQFLDSVSAGYAKLPLMYGDHSAYLLRTVKPGLSVIRLNERFLDTGDIGFLGFARVGGALLQSTVPPVLKLTMNTTGSWTQGSLT